MVKKYFEAIIKKLTDVDVLVAVAGYLGKSDLKCKQARKSAKRTMMLIANEETMTEEFMEDMLFRAEREFIQLAQYIAVKSVEQDNATAARILKEELAKAGFKATELFKGQEIRNEELLANTNKRYIKDMKVKNVTLQGQKLKVFNKEISIMGIIELEVI